MPDLYSDELMMKYRANGAQLPPHIFSIGINALNKLSIDKKSQSIIITGGSGSGKSFTAKMLTKFLYQGQIAEFAARVNTILEFFGNCETEQNDNSSRFVKLLKVIF